MFSYNMPSDRPKLDIPTEVWQTLSDAEFVNFSVPLLNPPTEFEGRVFWNGVELMRAGADIAALPHFKQVEAMMPYDEIFRVVVSPDGQTRAVIYSIYFERDPEEGWVMMYRLMNATLLVDAPMSSRLGWVGDGLPAVRWMLTSTEPCEWMSASEYAAYFGRGDHLRRTEIENFLRREVFRATAPSFDMTRAHVRLGDGETAILAPTDVRCCAVVFDTRRLEATSRLVMDDPTHLIAPFWRLASKVFVNAADRFEMAALSSDAWHYAQAVSEARATSDDSDAVLTSASFYC